MCETEGAGAVGRGGARKTSGFLAVALDGPPRLKNRHKFRPEIIFRLPDLLRPFSAGGMVRGLSSTFIRRLEVQRWGEDQSRAADRLSHLDGNPLPCQLLSAM